MKAHIALILLIVYASCTPGQEPNPTDYACLVSDTDSSMFHPKALQIEQLLEEKVRQGFPGISLSVKTSDGYTWHGARGKADLASGATMESCHPMLIASVSKVFTASCIMLLQQEGLLSTDDLLADHLKGTYMDKITNAKKVTIRQLMNHTSGLYDYLDPLKYELISINHPYKSDSPLKKLELAYGKPVNNSPGKTYYYSNTNYVLLGLLVEKLSGQSLSSYEQVHIFNPIGLSSSYAGTPKNPIPPGTPKGYLSIHANDVLMESEFYYHYDLATGDGNIGTTMRDLTAFMTALHSGDLLSSRSVDFMKESFELPEGWQDDFHKRNGHGLEIFETEYGTAYGHTGAIVGFLTTAWYFPDQNVSIMFSINGLSDKVFKVREEFTTEILDLVFQ